MPDNVLYNESGTTSFATDEIAGQHHQRVKVSLGADGVATDLTGDAVNGADVDVTRLPAIPAGANTIGRAQLRNPGDTANMGDATTPVRVDPTGTTTQPVSAASLPLPSGAATEATLGARLADATFTARINTQGQKAMAASTPVVLASDQSAVPVSVSNSPKSSTATAPAQTAVGTAAVQLLAVNASRKRAMVQNTGTTTIKLALGSTDPTQTAYHVALVAGAAADDAKGGTYLDEMWTGRIAAISSSAGGTVVVTELT